MAQELNCPWYDKGIPPCDETFNPDDEEVEDEFMTHVEKKHPEHIQEAAIISQGMGAGGISAIICNNPWCLGFSSPFQGASALFPRLTFNLIPILIVWILFPLYILRVRKAFLLGTILSIFGIIYTFAFPSILVDVRTWYLFTDPVRDFPFVMLQLILVVNAYTSFKTYTGEKRRKQRSKEIVDMIEKLQSNKTKRTPQAK